MHLQFNNVTIIGIGYFYLSRYIGVLCTMHFVLLVFPVINMEPELAPQLSL